MQKDLVQFVTAGAGLERLVDDHRLEMLPPGPAQARGRIEGKAVRVKVRPERLPVGEGFDGVGHVVDLQRAVDPLPEAIQGFMGQRADVAMVDGPEGGIGRRAEVEQQRRIDDQAIQAQPDEGANLRSSHFFGPGAGVDLFGKGIGRAALLDGQGKAVHPLQAGQGVRHAAGIGQEGPDRAVAQRPAKVAQAFDDDTGQPFARLGMEQDQEAGLLGFRSCGGSVFFVHCPPPLKEAQKRVGWLAALEPAIPQAQREQDQQAQEPEGIHDRDAGAIGRQQVAEPHIQD